jgi:hypothetical protein
MTDADTVVMLKKVRAQKAKAKKAASNLEDHVALQFADHYADHFRYIAEWNRWLLWNGVCWQHERSLAAFDKARVLCREAEDAKAKTVAAVVTLARTDRAIAATEDQWDVDREIFNLPLTQTEREESINADDRTEKRPDPTI